jgi:hypothetical protein
MEVSPGVLLAALFHQRPDVRMVGLESGGLGGPPIDQIGEALLELARLAQRGGRRSSRLLTEGAGRQLFSPLADARRFPLLMLQHPTGSDQRVVVGQVGGGSFARLLGELLDLEDRVEQDF